MGSIFPVFAMLFVVLGLMACSALFVPKGPNQVYVNSFDPFTCLSPVQDHTYSPNAYFCGNISHVDDHIHGTTSPTNSYVPSYFTISSYPYIQ